MIRSAEDGTPSRSASAIVSLTTSSRGGRAGPHRVVEATPSTGSRGAALASASGAPAARPDHVTGPRGAPPRGDPRARGVRPHRRRRDRPSRPPDHQRRPHPARPRDTLQPRELARAIEEAQRRGLITHDQLILYLTSRRSHRGAARLRAATKPTPQLTRSEAERRFLALIDRASLPTPAANTRVARYEVDFLGPRSASSWRSTATRSTPRARRSSVIACAMQSSRCAATGSSGSRGAASPRTGGRRRARSRRRWPRPPSATPRPCARRRRRRRCGPPCARAPRRRPGARRCARRCRPRG